MSIRVVLLLFLLLLAALIWGVHAGRITMPEPWNPWAPLRIDAPPNVWTRFKLARASADPAACRAALTQADMRWVPLDDRVRGEGCGFTNAVRVERTSVAIREPFALSCRAALSLAMWERHALQRAAMTHLGSRVRAIEHFGSYACRNLYGEPGRRRSRHATADAIDVAAFVLEDGRRVSVARDWEKPVPDKGNAPSRAAIEGNTVARATGEGDASPDSPEARFLRDVRDGACRHFDVVLGPEYNRAHADHFHFDRGAGRICR